MSATKITYIYCDGEDCPIAGQPYSADVGPTETAAVQRKYYGASGWKYVGGKDYCPECVERRAVGGRTDA